MKNSFWVNVGGLLLMGGLVGCGGGISHGARQARFCAEHPHDLCAVDLVDYAAEDRADAVATYRTMVEVVTSECARLKTLARASTVTLRDEIDLNNIAATCLQVASVQLGAVGVDAGRVSMPASELDPDAIPPNFVSGVETLEFLCAQAEDATSMNFVYTAVTRTDASSDACLMLGDIRHQLGRDEEAGAFYQFACSRIHAQDPARIAECVRSASTRADAHWCAAPVRELASQNDAHLGALPRITEGEASLVVAGSASTSTHDSHPPTTAGEVARPRWEELAGPRTLTPQEDLRVVSLGDSLFASVFAANTPAEIYRSEDVGSTWVRVPGDFPEGCISAASGALYVGCRDVVRSTDGQTFAPIGELHGSRDEGAWRFVSFGSRTIAYNTGRVFLSDDGRRWRNRTPRDIRSIAGVAASSTRIFVCGQSPSVGYRCFESENETSWSARRDTAEFERVYESGGQLFVGSDRTVLRASVDGGATFVAAMDHTSLSASSVLQAGGLFWIGSGAVSVSGDGGRRWRATRDSTVRPVVQSIAHARDHIVVVTIDRATSSSVPRIERLLVSEGRRLFDEYSARFPIERRLRVLVAMAEGLADHPAAPSIRAAVEERLGASWQVEVVTPPADAGSLDAMLTVSMRQQAPGQDAYVLRGYLRSMDGSLAFEVETPPSTEGNRIHAATTLSDQVVARLPGQ